MRWSLILPWEQMLCEFQILPLSSRALAVCHSCKLDGAISTLNVSRSNGR
jgi:hypothetical protein